ncbi:DUF58 domain-containing protein [Gorillibacterium timonense]|uniref:DUF58 domain-containing protein n=1 Tax=Gorillibacterium timonense TaxID=1689269 RepID=UPI00071D00B7|nr:DUF58 domain-containing protein [Gorillibacterium timonense]
MSGSLLFPDPRDLYRLERMTLSSKSRIRGTIQGRRRSRQAGSSLEFADYRLYAPGDDTRQLDWNVFGRTGKPFIKQFLDERELQVHLYIDCSRSMDFGGEGGGYVDPGSASSSQGGSRGSADASDLTKKPANSGKPESGNDYAAATGTGTNRDGNRRSGRTPAAANKFLHARRLAASIGYLALAGYDRTDVRFFGERISRELPLLRGKGSAHRLFSFLEETETEPTGDIAAAIMSPLAVPKQPGMTWIFSDFLYETGVEEALGYLQAARQEVMVVQVLSPEEVSPELFGDLRLVDSESGTGKEVALSPKVLRAYKDAVQQYTTGLASFCRERGMGYAAALTDVPSMETLDRLFRSGGMIR